VYVQGDSLTARAAITTGGFSTLRSRAGSDMEALLAEFRSRFWDAVGWNQWHPYGLCGKQVRLIEVTSPGRGVAGSAVVVGAFR